MPEDEQILRNYAIDNDIQRTLENSEWISIVRLMAEELSSKQKLVFTLCQLEGLSSEEVQEITGLDARQHHTKSQRLVEIKCPCKSPCQ